MEPIETILQTMKQVVLDAGKVILSRKGCNDVRKKGYADYVTAIDLQVQNTICGRLQEVYPEIQFMGEEKDNSDLDFTGAVWILDPVDGTTNLIRDMHMSVVSLALVVNRAAVAGVIYQPYTGELFYAAKGKGAFMNDEPVCVSVTQQMKDSIVAMGTGPYYHEYADWTFDAGKRVFQSCLDIRRSGSAALDIAYLAAGRVDGMYELILQPWDVAAGKIILEEAGGRMTDLQGKDLDLTRHSSILASNGRIHQQLQQILQPN